MFIRHYVIALFGDLAKTKIKKLEDNFDNIITLLIQHLNIPNKSANDPYAEDKIHICNNSCWTLERRKVEENTAHMQHRHLVILLIPLESHGVELIILVSAGFQPNAPQQDYPLD